MKYNNQYAILYGNVHTMRGYLIFRRLTSSHKILHYTVNISTLESQKFDCVMLSFEFISKKFMESIF